MTPVAGVIVPSSTPSGYEPPRLSVEDIIEREVASGVRFGPFHRRWLQARAPERVHRMLELAALRPGVVGTRQYFTAPDVADFPPASFTAVTASATETNLWTPAVWTPIPAQDMRAGKIYNVKFGGVYTSTTANFTFTPRAGQSATPASNVTLGASGTVAAPASQTAAPWYGEFTLGIRAVDIAFTGITGTGNGVVVCGAAAAAGTAFVLGGAVATTISNAAASGLIVSVTLSAVSQSVTCQWVSLRSFN